jgi:putative hydrolase of the HAD superfamily
MVDVDGVLVDERPEDGRHWHASIEEDLGFTSGALQEQFFAPYWENIVLGRAGLMEHLVTALHAIAPDVSAARCVAYWFERDSRLVAPVLAELSLARSSGIRVYLATNQEHLRAAYLMEKLGLAQHVDGIFYSARLGAKKPDLEFFAKVQAAVGLRGEELLLVDDSDQNIEAALTSWHALINEVLMARVRIIHAESGETYGAPRVHRALQAEGLPARPKRVARLMREEGLVARPRKRPRVSTTDSNHDQPVAPNRLRRQFDVNGVGINRVWVADITYVPTREGVLYLATVLDLGSRRCVGWAMRDTLDVGLALSALRMACEARRPAPGLMHHSDRGSQGGFNMPPGPTKPNSWRMGWSAA